MIRCGKCGTFYEELTKSNCPKCGEKAHMSVGKCLLCGEEAERGDVCNKCIKDYEIKAEVIAEDSKVDLGGGKSHALTLRVIANFMIVASILGAIAIGAIPTENGQPNYVLLVIELLVSLFGCFLLKCFAEHLEKMEKITQQLEEIKEVIRLK